eukprot:6491647-Amphidinium_carterae.2
MARKDNIIVSVFPTDASVGRASVGRVEPRGFSSPSKSIRKETQVMGGPLPIRPVRLGPTPPVRAAS